MPLWLIAFFESPFGAWLTRQFWQEIVMIVTYQVTKLVQKLRQSSVDKENLVKYDEVKQGTLDDKEDIKRTEDLLSGNKPRP